MAECRVLLPTERCRTLGQVSEKHTGSSSRLKTESRRRFSRVVASRIIWQKKKSSWPHNARSEANPRGVYSLSTAVPRVTIRSTGRSTLVGPTTFCSICASCRYLAPSISERKKILRDSICSKQQPNQDASLCRSSDRNAEPSSPEEWQWTESTSFLFYLVACSL